MYSRISLMHRWNKFYFMQGSPVDAINFDEDFTAEIPKLTPIEKDLLISMDQEQFTNFSYTSSSFASS